MYKITTVVELAGIGGVLCHGCFDVLHYGHIRHLQAAKAMLPNHPLTVTVTSDRFIHKGPGRPVFPAEIRAECLAALSCVDYVAIVDESTGLSAIEMIRPQIYVKGSEYIDQGGVTELERLEVAAIGGTMAYTERWYSTTRLLERAHA